MNRVKKGAYVLMMDRLLLPEKIQDLDPFHEQKKVSDNTNPNSSHSTAQNRQARGIRRPGRQKMREQSTPP